MVLTQQGHWQVVAQARKERRAEGRRRGTQALQHAGIAFSALDGGWHLRIETKDHVIDYTPGSGRWRIKGQAALNAGVRTLIHFINSDSSQVGAERREP
jgi:hypothetical protein